MAHNYLIRNVSDIRRGRIVSSDGPITAGWAMGPFYATHEPAFTRDFEIKEWDEALVNRSWDDHAHNGPEYISVTRGTLTIIFGERRSDIGPPVETERVDVIAGYSVVLQSGLWRRFECTQDATGVSVRRPGIDTGRGSSARY